MVRIRKRYLEAMERGDFSHLPEGAPARGFVRNYARFLGLNPEAAVAALEAEIGVPVILREAQLPPPERPRMTSRYTQLEPPGARWRGALPDETTAELDALALNEEQHSANNGLVPTPPDAASRLPSAWRLRPASDSGPNGAQRLPRSPHLRPLSSPKPSAHSSTWLRRALRMFAAITIVASAAGLLLPRLSSVVETLSNAARPATPSTAAPQIIPASTPAAATTRPTPTSAAPSATTPNLAGIVQLVLDVRERAWIRVRADERVVFEGFLPLGPSAPFNGKSVAIETANAGAFEIILNGQRLGVLGERNQTVRRTWTAQTP